MKIRTMLAATSFAVALAVSPAVHAQQAPIAPSSASKDVAAAPTWTTEQLVTATVHQAWLMSNKNEATFFEMVTQLAEISAKNRDITLPQTTEAGRQFGEMIKRMAKADTDQLLYSVVDKAVVKIGKPAA